MKNRDTISSKVSDFINKYIGHSEDAYRKELSIDYLLLELQITKIEYYWELSITSENDFQFHLKRIQITALSIITILCYLKNGKLALISRQFTNILKLFLIWQHTFLSQKIQHQKQTVQEIKLQNFSARVAMTKIGLFICLFQTNVTSGSCLSLFTRIMVKKMTTRHYVFER